MLRLAFDFIITWRETRTRPNAYLFGELPRLLISQAYINKVKIWKFLFFFILCTSY